jgi:hypothetical protein
VSMLLTRFVRDGCNRKTRLSLDRPPHEIPQLRRRALHEDRDAEDPSPAHTAKIAVARTRTSPSHGCHAGMQKSSGLLGLDDQDRDLEARCTLTFPDGNAELVGA